MSFFDPTNKKPGPYFTEKKSDKVIIQGIPRSACGVVGVTKWGPFEPTIVYSLAEFKKIFGGAISSLYPTYKQVGKAYKNYEKYGDPSGSLAMVIARIAHYTDPTDKATLAAVKATGYAYDAVPAAATIGTVVAGGSNNEDGDQVIATGAGPYTGTLNGSYKIKVAEAGADFAHSLIAKYFIGEDGTETLLGTSIPVSGVAITLEKGITFTVTAGVSAILHLNDTWTVAVKAAGKATGDRRILGTGKYHGSLGNVITADISTPTNAVSGCFDITVKVDGVEKEKFINCSPDSESDDYFVTKVASDYIVLADTSNVADVGIPQTITMFGGDDGTTGLVEADYTGNADAKTGVHMLDTVSYPLRVACFDGDVIAVAADLTTRFRNLLAWCDGVRKRNFLISNVPKDISKAADLTTFSSGTYQLDSRRNALYFGWGYDEDDKEVIPLTGAILGLYAAIADVNGCWENPAGDEYPLQGFTGIYTKLGPVAAGIANELRINVCEETDKGIIVNGSRTRAFTEAANYSWIGQTINTQDLEARIETNCKVRHKLARKKLYDTLFDIAKGILSTREKEGGLDNETGKAWDVVCNESIQEPELKAKGVTKVKWGVRNWKTSEFQWFELTPFTDGSVL